MYANDDQTFPPEVVTPFHQKYIVAGGDAPLKTFPSGSHGFTLATDSLPMEFPGMFIIPSS